MGGCCCCGESPPWPELGAEEAEGDEVGGEASRQRTRWAALGGDRPRAEETASLGAGKRGGGSSSPDLRATRRRPSAGRGGPPATAGGEEEVGDGISEEEPTGAASTNGEEGGTQGRRGRRPSPEGEERSRRGWGSRRAEQMARMKKALARRSVGGLNRLG